MKRFIGKTIDLGPLYKPDGRANSVGGELCFGLLAGGVLIQNRGGVRMFPRELKGAPTNRQRTRSRHKRIDEIVRLTTQGLL